MVSYVFVPYTNELKIFNFCSFEHSNWIYLIMYLKISRENLLTCVKLESSHSSLQTPVVRKRLRLLWHEVQNVGEFLPHVTHEESQGSQTRCTLPSLTISDWTTVMPAGHWGTHDWSILLRNQPSRQVAHWSVESKHVRQLSLQREQTLDLVATSATQPDGQLSLH